MKNTQRRESKILLEPLNRIPTGEEAQRTAQLRQECQTQEAQAKSEAQSEAAMTAICYHESGHAVAAFHFGRPLAFTRIITEDFGKHHGEPVLCIRGETKVRIADEDMDLIILAAGPQAEYKRQGCLTAALEAGYDDFQLIQVLWDDCDNCAVEELGTRTSDLVEAHWGEIEAVAEALMERRQLSGREVARLCYQARHERDSCGIVTRNR